MASFVNGGASTPTWVLENRSALSNIAKQYLWDLGDRQIEPQQTTDICDTDHPCGLWSLMSRLGINRAE